MANIYFKEIFDYPIQEFSSHLGKIANDRIIFSGKYGTGKTRFLENFFKQENQNQLFGKNKYSIYRLFPTNYSIASNEDIIRYIKYDIIIEMLKNSIKLDEVKLKLEDTLPSYLVQNIDKVTAGIVYMIPKLGKEIVDCFDRIDTLKEEYLKYHDKINISSGDRLIEYLERLEIKDGSIYENDITTKIISEVISTDNQEESVLIIDDVDRLDPEHVFRILNVFASHFEDNLVSGVKNKFNFDKIIIVCDFNNIRNIFHNRYGINVDFIGYIDKFYSNDVYNFDNKKAIIGITNKIFESLKFEIIGSDDPIVISQLYFKNKFISELINVLVAGGFISLRNIVRLYEMNIACHYEKIYFDKRNEDIIAWRCPLMMQLKLLRAFFADYENMINAFTNISFTEEFVEDYEKRMGEFLYLLNPKSHNFDPGTDSLIYYQDLPIVLEAKAHAYNDQFYYANLYNWSGEKQDDVPLKGIPLKITPELFKSALKDCIELLHRKGYIK